MLRLRFFVSLHENYRTILMSKSVLNKQLIYKKHKCNNCKNGNFFHPKIICQNKKPTLSAGFSLFKEIYFIENLPTPYQISKQNFPVF